MDRRRHHECEIFESEGKQETSESDLKWKRCRKNPGHHKFIPAQDFKDNYLPKVQNSRTRDVLRAKIDLTVRLRVCYTSTERPDDDGFAMCRGKKLLRTGSGILEDVYPPETNTPCPCVECGGESPKKHWRFTVRTARHVVFNTEEAQHTKVDLFLDEESCEQDGRMKSVGGLSVLLGRPNGDRCDMLCVTCDLEVGAWIESFCRYDDVKIIDADLADLDVLPFGEVSPHPAMIVSHPHGQAKKVTFGGWSREDDSNKSIIYNVPTCPGSSGAPVFGFRSNQDTRKFDGLNLFFSPHHSGSLAETDKEEQVNFGLNYFQLDIDLLFAQFLG